MAIRIISALLLFCALSRAEDPVMPEFGAISPGGAPEEAAAMPDGTEAEEIRQIRDKIMTSLFFKGEVADGIIESGMQDQFVPTAGLETYADVKQALLEWIGKNPDEAAKAWYYLKKHGPRAPKGPTVIKKEWVEFNPTFLRLIAAVNKAAGDNSIPREEVSLIASRLFQGHEIEAEAGAPVIAGGKDGGRAPQGSGSAGALEYADYKLDPAAAGREARNMSGALEGLKTAFEEDSDKEGLKLSGSAFDLYKRFLVALSALKGRKSISEAESKNLEALRRELRSKLAAITALGARNRLRARSAALPAGGPGADILLKEALELMAAFDAFSAGGGKDGGARRLYGLQKAGDFWTFKFIAYMRLAGLKGRLAKTGFSCALDKIVFELLAKLAPSAGYPRLKKDLRNTSFTIAWALEGVAAGDAALTGKFAGGSGEALFAKIEELERKLAAVEACSRRNRRLQFLFWDIFLNPPGLEPALLGVRARNKLLL